MAAPGLRIIAGQWRSRRIAAPPPECTRPMPDRVKEAIFDVLGSWLATPGELPPLQVLDLFAGSGSLGLEAVSRGAAACLFVEQHARAVAVLRANLLALGTGPSMRIEVRDAWTCSVSRLRSSHSGFGLVFVDPPYADARDTARDGRVPRLLDRLMTGDLLAPEVIAVLHHERAVRFEPVPGSVWVPTRRREYGHTAITYVTRTAVDPPQPGGPPDGQDEQEGG